MRNKIVFASDFHLGIDSKNTSKQRELLIVEWLMSMKDEMKELFLVGDVFDYWFEYKTSIPKGFSDFLSAIKVLRNEGVKITMFTGNHDMWMFNYFTEEYGIEVFKDPKQYEFNGSSFFIGHGDGLGPGDHVYKVVKKVFASKLCQWLFSLLHPTLALGIMKRISQRDAEKYTKPEVFNAEEEWLIKFAEENNREQSLVNYYIFGHRHWMYDHSINEQSRVINLGDWISFLSYAVWDGKELKLLQYEQDNK